MKPGTASSPTTTRGNPSTQWRSVCLQQQQKANNDDTTATTKQHAAVNIIHMNWMHSTRPILMTVDDQSQVWVVDLDDDHVTTKNDTTSRREISFEIIFSSSTPSSSKPSSSSSLLTTAASIQTWHENYSTVTTDIADKLMMTKSTSNDDGHDDDHDDDFIVGAVANKGSIISLFPMLMKKSDSVSSWKTSNSNLNWNCGSSEKVQISEIQLSPGLNSDDERDCVLFSSSVSSKRTFVKCIAYSQTSESLFVCYKNYENNKDNKNNNSTTRKTHSQNIVRKIRGSSRLLFASKLTSFDFFSANACLVARGRELNVLELTPQLFYANVNQKSKKDLEPEGQLYELPFLFFSEDVPCLKKLGPFSLEKKFFHQQHHHHHHHNHHHPIPEDLLFATTTASSSSIDNELAFLVTRGGTARILMRSQIAAKMGIGSVVSDDGKKSNQGGDLPLESSTGGKKKFLLDDEHLFDDDTALQQHLIGQEWFETSAARRKLKQQKSSLLVAAANNNNNNNRQAPQHTVVSSSSGNNNTNNNKSKNGFEADDLFSEFTSYTEMVEKEEKAKKQKRYADEEDDYHYNDDENDENANNNNSTGRYNDHYDRLESVCTCEVPGGDGYIKSCSVSPSGSVVTFGFESGVIVVGFVAARESPALLNFNNSKNNTTSDHHHHHQSSSSSSSSSFFITSCPQLMFITKIMSRIPRRAPTQLVVDERRASVLCLDASGVLELLIFPSALRRRPTGAASAAAGGSSSASAQPEGALLSGVNATTNEAYSASVHHNKAVLCSCVQRLASAQRASSPLDASSSSSPTSSTAVMMAMMMSRLPPMKSSSGVVGNSDSPSVKAISSNRQVRSTHKSSNNGSSSSSSSARALKISGELELFKKKLFENCVVVSSSAASTSSSESIENDFNRLCWRIALKTEPVDCSDSSFWSTLTEDSNNNSIIISSENHNNDPNHNNYNHNNNVMMHHMNLNNASSKTFAVMMKMMMIMNSFRNTSHPEAMYRYLSMGEKGQFTPHFNPFTCTVLSNDNLMVLMLNNINNSGLNGGVSGNNNNKRMMTSLMNAIEIARAQVFVRSAPTLGPSTTATKFRAWRQLMGQKMKRVFVATNNNNSNNHQQQQNKQQQIHHQNRQQKSSNDNDNDDQFAAATATRNNILGNVEALDKICAMREELILARFLIDDEATQLYCSPFVVAP